MSFSSANSSQCVKCNDNLSSIICCGKKLCTSCFYFSYHVRHTPLHHHVGSNSSHAVVTDSKKCRLEVITIVKPVFEKVWNELAADISKECDKQSKRMRVDPLSSLLDDDQAPSVKKKSMKKKKNASSTSISTIVNNTTQDVTSSITMDQQVAVMRQGEGEGSSGRPTTVVDVTRRTLTRPHDMWNHTGKLKESTLTSENSIGGGGGQQQPVVHSGPKCPICFGRDTSKMDDFDRGRKSEIWGSASSRCTIDCKSCGHRWSIDD
jgi:hypothetical protein